MKPIRNYIVRTDINEANDQKKPKMTTPCYSCRKTCHLISSDGTLKNVHSEKEIKKLKNYMEETAEYQTLFPQQDVKYM